MRRRVFPPRSSPPPLPNPPAARVRRNRSAAQTAPGQPTGRRRMRSRGAGRLIGLSVSPPVTKPYRRTAVPPYRRTALPLTAQRFLLGSILPYHVDDLPTPIPLYLLDVVHPLGGIDPHHGRVAEGAQDLHV